MELKDTVALVTGGSGGLGRRICHKLASEGIHIAVMYSRSKKEADFRVAGVLNTCTLAIVFLLCFLICGSYSFWFLLKCPIFIGQGWWAGLWCGTAIGLGRNEGAQRLSPDQLKFEICKKEKEKGLMKNNPKTIRNYPQPSETIRNDSKRNSTKMV